jgi:hypothetical protein
MGNNKIPNQKQPAKTGPDHYNPGNMSGKTIGTRKDEPEQSNADRDRQHDQQAKKPSTEE